MSGLADYLALKGAAVRGFVERILQPGYVPRPLAARVTVEGRSGIRRIRIRDFQMVADSPPDLLGYNLGPSSPEIALASLGGCLAHSWLIHAATLGVTLDAVEIEVTATIDNRAGEAGHETQPREPQGIGFVAHVSSPASDAELAAVQERVMRLCPILNLFRNPQQIGGVVRRAVAA